MVLFKKKAKPGGYLYLCPAPDGRCWKQFKTERAMRRHVTRKHVVGKNKKRGR